MKISDNNFLRPFVKGFALCYRTVVCLSACNVGVLWPNGMMHYDATWYGGRQRLRLHCVRSEPSSPTKRHSPQSSAHVTYCRKTAGWIKM